MRYTLVSFSAVTIAIFLFTLDAAAALPASIEIADRLSLRNSGRAAGKSLGTMVTEQGAAKWTTGLSVVFINPEGVTSSDTRGGTAAHAIPATSGKIHIQAEIKPVGSRWTGIAVGRGNMANDFWNSYDLLVYLGPAGNYEVVSRGEQLAHGDSTSYPEFRPEGFNTVSLEYDTIARSVTVWINGGPVLKACDLSSKKYVLAIAEAGFRFNEEVIPGSPAVRNYRAELTVQATAGLKPLEIDEFFLTPDQPILLTWKAAIVGPSDRIAYEIRDYWGQSVARGEGTVKSDGAVNVLLKALSRGYYEIYFPQSRETFGIVALEAQTGMADPFFCIDAGLSWLETREELRPALVHSLHRSGIGMTRERLSWGTVNPDRDQWDWEGGPRKYASLRKTYADQSVPILEILQGGPRHLGMLRSCPFPQNLVEVARSWKMIGAQFHSGWGATEIWNEPDLEFMPADQYVVLVKTAALALQESRISTPIVGGVFATIPPGSYFDTCAANGMLDQVDGVSFHTYDPALDMQGMVGRYRAWLKASGKERLPLWVSESGLPWESGPDRPPPDQAADSALEITMKGIESRACGIARYFPFVYTFY
jgi:hypothetical protein